jgi:hypothetical protein
VQEEVGSRLAALHLGCAEHALLEAGEESCWAKRETHLVVTAARRHARLGGDAIERFHDAVDGPELRGEGGAVEMFELLLPIVGEVPPRVSLDFRADGGIREADESLDHPAFIVTGNRS